MITIDKLKEEVEETEEMMDNLCEEENPLIKRVIEKYPETKAWEWE